MTHAHFCFLHQIDLWSAAFEQEFVLLWRIVERYRDYLEVGTRVDFEKGRHELDLGDYVNDLVNYLLPVSQIKVSFWEAFAKQGHANRP